MKIDITGLGSAPKAAENADAQYAADPSAGGLRIDVSGLASAPTDLTPSGEASFDPALYARTATGIGRYTLSAAPLAASITPLSTPAPLNTQATSLDARVTQLSTPTPLDIDVTPLSAPTPLNTQVTPLNTHVTPLSINVAKRSANADDERKYRTLTRLKNASAGLAMILAFGVIGFAEQKEPQYGKALLSGLGAVAAVNLSNHYYDKRRELEDKILFPGGYR